VLGRLAQASGGVLFEPDTIQEVRGALQEVSTDIRRSYILGFSPEGLDDSFHAIRVEASAPGSGRLRARTRSGYLASSPKPVDHADR
jgi:hypothetical protein